MVGKLSNTCEIENFLKQNKTIEANYGVKASEIDDVILSKEQNEVLDICKNQLKPLEKG